MDSDELSRDASAGDSTYEVEPARALRPEEVLQRLNAEAAERYAKLNPPPPSRPPLRESAFSLRYLLGATTLLGVLFGAMRSPLGMFLAGLTLLMAFSILSRDEFYGTRVDLLLWILSVVYLSIAISVWAFGWHVFGG